MTYLLAPLPGLAQALRGERTRGAGVLLLFASAVLFVAWWAQPVWVVFPLIIWLWNLWDARVNRPILIPCLAWMLNALGIGVAVTEFDLLGLWRNAERAASILRPMLRPDLFVPGTLTPSFNGGYIFEGLGQTLGMALLSTTVGAVVAVPLAFVAARTLMSANALTRGIYFGARSLMNITRSIESLIMAIIFVKVVGLGPFAGFIALTIHTAAALAKLFSEVIESIDPGPIEAIRGTGANWVQVARHAVIPQIVPQFTALTIFRWDINVRSSTIIGVVGGGGIGFFLNQWIRNGDYRAVSASFIVIAVVVVLMDFLSARIRARIN